MTVKERVLISRLIQKIESSDGYARQIGLGYAMMTEGCQRSDSKRCQKKEKKN